MQQPQVHIVKQGQDLPHGFQKQPHVICNPMQATAPQCSRLDAVGLYAVILLTEAGPCCVCGGNDVQTWDQMVDFVWAICCTVQSLLMTTLPSALSMWMASRNTITKSNPHSSNRDVGPGAPARRRTRRPRRFPAGVPRGCGYYVVGLPHLVNIWPTKYTHTIPSSCAAHAPVQLSLPPILQGAPS